MDPAYEGSRLDPLELQALLVLSEELHFGRTAQRLGVSQPRVSQLIRQLERRVGRRLVERTSRRVVINRLGEQLLSGVRPAFAALQRAFEDTRTAAHGLRVGFLAPYVSTLDRGIGALRVEHPQCTVSLVQIHWTDVFGPLRRGAVDAQICLAPVEQPGVMVGPTLATFPRQVAVARSGKWATRPALTLEDLGDTPVIGPHPSVPAELARSFWPPATTPAGRPIRFVTAARTEPEMLSAVAHSDAVFVTSTAMPTRFNHPGVVFVPFEGLPDATVVLVWPEGTDHPTLDKFAALAASSGAVADRMPVGR
ncbi:LysR family transcriptional regulator [Nocardia stercoris]|uniref:LysR family transcriptional regulator n=1 Tax=Nocardia stercoris TaxID=2483361 RepID=A0A3M2KWP6_9NOCA|nr:LysR family transcriptional regulator [Nocardia stercoris]RMI29919.1 LysR family transcriptional regulator [Nocardia stercoris]